MFGGGVGMFARSLVVALALAVLVVFMHGCASPESRLIGHWVSPKDQAEVVIEKSANVWTVEIVENGQSSKFPGTYKDGTLTIQNMWVTVSFYPDPKTGELIANMGGQENRLQRKK